MRAISSRAEAAHVYKVCGRLCSCFVAAHSDRDTGLSVFRKSELGRRLVVLLVVIGFPIALMIAWAFESTPEGIKRTQLPTRRVNIHAQSLDLHKHPLCASVDRLFFWDAIPLEMQRLDTMPVRLGPRRLQRRRKVHVGVAVA